MPVPIEASPSSSTGSTNSILREESAISGKQILKITPNIVLPSTPARETSEFFDSINNLDPIKFSPPQMGGDTKMPDAHISYSSLARLNPYHDDRFTRLEDFYDAHMPARRSSEKLQNMERKTLPGLPRSQSEASIALRSGLSQDSNSEHTPRVPYNHTFLSNDGDAFRLSEETITSSSNSRGRSIIRTPSPTKNLEDIKEDQSPESPTPIKRSRSPMKQMFGERGWLGKSMSMKELPSEEYRKTGLKHWGGKIKQRVEHMTENMSRSIPNPINTQESPPKRSNSKTRFHVSLSPPMQAKLYSEIELMICATANQYLNVQQQEGRMTVDSLTKVTQTWTSKNRPQVIEFMFDQATQRDLVLYNIKTFHFYGPLAENIISMNSMMQSWKTLAKEMSVRTFCMPDAVIRKHMHDTYRILEMLGAPLVTFLAFQEIQIKVLKVMREEQKKKDDYEAIKFGVERRWEPPQDMNATKREEFDNPYA